MSDRTSAFTVVLERDLRPEDSEQIRMAILSLRYVLSVTPVIEDIGAFIAQGRARRELECKLWEVLYPKEKET